MSKCTCPFECAACTEFSTTKAIRSTHKKECSWHGDKTSCNCNLFSPLGLYVPFVPLQTSTIFVKEEKKEDHND